MKVSVIIPTFNRAGFLKKAVDSVLGQTLADLELIVVDDGSEDATRQVLNSFNDKRLRYYYQENRGVSAARNLGLDKARGKYAAFLDSDDYWLPKKLELQTRFMAQSGFRISQTQEIWIRNGTRVNPMARHRQPCGWIFEKSLELCLISPSCVVMDMGLVRQGYRFDESLPACEDFDLWLKISSVCRVGLLPEALTVRLGGHAGQLSGRIIGLDLYRIYSMLGIEKGGGLNSEQASALDRVLLKKAQIYLKGCLKRARFQEALRIKELLKSRPGKG
ncbi:glycosyltransferase family 2 protein [Desulfonatronovibrio hydrogenovorans]|uniref:glycosyltransferase family 2 protein n=1 Tax=Desulfonatronovibrio hydrogenovorans TaxID=53245 RepID=UPI00048E5CBA|nr:glycosyltransferase family 2 protein [Desulfonatronovibrio hydrogenovorans]